MCNVGLNSKCNGGWLYFFPPPKKSTKAFILVEVPYLCSDCLAKITVNVFWTWNRNEVQQDIWMLRFPLQQWLWLLQVFFWWLKIISVPKFPYLCLGCCWHFFSLGTSSYWELLETLFKTFPLFSFPLFSLILRQLYPVAFALCRGLF